MALITRSVRPSAEREDAVPVAGRARRKIDRPQQARIAGDVGDDLALVPDVVAGGDDVDAGGVELLADLVGDAEAMRRVLAVGDDEIEREVAAQPRHMLDDDVAPGAPDHVTAKKHPHAIYPSRRRRTIRIRSS